MKELSDYIKEFHPEVYRRIEKTDADSKEKLKADLKIEVDDLVQFRKKDLSRVQIIGKVLSITNTTYHVKTFFPFKGIDEFYLDIKEVRKYDPT